MRAYVSTTIATLVLAAACSRSPPRDTAAPAATPSNASLPSRNVEFVEQTGHWCCGDLAFDPSGRLLASLGANEATVWDLDSGLELRSFRSQELRSAGSQSTLSSGDQVIAFDSDGTRLAVALMSFRSPAVDLARVVPNVWNLRTGDEISAGEWLFDEQRRRATKAGVPFDNRDPALWRWQVSSSPDVAARLRLYKGDAQAFSRDGTLAVGLTGTRGSYPNSVCDLEAVDVAAGIVRWRTEVPVNSCGSRPAVSPDGRWVGLTGRVWDARTGTAAPVPWATGEYWGIAFAPGGRVVVARDGIARVFETSAWTLVATLAPASTADHKHDVLTISADGGRVASGTRNSNSICTWRTADGALEQCLTTGQSTPISTTAISADGGWLALGASGFTPYQGVVWLRSIHGTGPPRHVLSEEGTIQSIAFSNDGRHLAAASLQTVDGHRSNGDLQGNLTVCTLPGCDDPTKLLDRARDLSRLNLLDSPEQGARGVAFAAGSLVALVLGTRAHTDEEIRFHELWPYQRLMTFRGPPWTRQREWTVYQTEHADDSGAFAVSSDGSRAITSGDDLALDIWNLSTGRRAGVLNGYGGAAIPGSPRVQAIAFNPDGSRLATAGDRQVTIWSVLDRKVVAQPATGQFGAFAFSHDGKTLAARECLGQLPWDMHARLHVWDTSTWRERWSVDTSGPCEGALTFTPSDGAVLEPRPFTATIRAADTGRVTLSIAVSLKSPETWVAWTPDLRYVGSPEGVRTLVGVRDGLRVRALADVSAAKNTPTLLADLLR